MKYFFDTEFIESFNKPLFGKRRHYIDMISIGIVSEDGRVYQAISNEFLYNDADDWVRKNVLQPLYDSILIQNRSTLMNVQNFQFFVGKSNAQIANEIVAFMNDPEGEYLPDFKGSSDKYFNHIRTRLNIEKHEIYAYYADYDWVLLCSLFGRMIDLPNGFPMYCRDIKQMLDDKGITKQELEKHVSPNTSPHIALDDAQWNKRVYEYIISK